MHLKNQPDIKSYIDVHLYLKDYYHARKQHDDHFSYQLWSQELGISGKSHLRQIILGLRAMTEEITHKLATYLQLENIDREYFFLLVIYTQSKQPEQKRYYGKKMTQLLRSYVSSRETDPVDSLIADPLNLIVRNILSFTDTPNSPAFLSELCNISEERVLEILENLQRDNFVRNEQGRWIAQDSSVWIKREKNNLALKNYHKLSLLKALESQTLPSDERSYKTLSVALSPENYQQYLQDLNDFSKNVLAKYDCDELSGKRIYQMNFCVFPWTQILETPADEELGSIEI